MSPIFHRIVLKRLPTHLILTTTIRIAQVLLIEQAHCIYTAFIQRSVEIPLDAHSRTHRVFG